MVRGLKIVRAGNAYALAVIEDQLHDEPYLEFPEQRLDRAHHSGLTADLDAIATRAAPHRSDGQSPPPRRHAEARSGIDPSHRRSGRYAPRTPTPLLGGICSARVTSLSGMYGGRRSAASHDLEPPTHATADGSGPEGSPRSRESFCRRVPCESRLHRLEPASALTDWLLVGLHHPVFTASCDLAAVDLVEGKRVVRADGGMGDTHSRDDGVPLRDNPQQFDRPALRDSCG